MTDKRERRGSAAPGTRHRQDHRPGAAQARLRPHRDRQAVGRHRRRGTVSRERAAAYLLSDPAGGTRRASRARRKRAGDGAPAHDPSGHRTGQYLFRLPRDRRRPAVPARDRNGAGVLRSATRAGGGRSSRRGRQPDGIDARLARTRDPALRGGPGGAGANVSEAVRRIRPRGPDRTWGESVSHPASSLVRVRRRFSATGVRIDFRAGDDYLRGGPRPPNGLQLFWKEEE